MPEPTLGPGRAGDLTRYARMDAYFREVYASGAPLSNPFAAGNKTYWVDANATNVTTAAGSATSASTPCSSIATVLDSTLLTAGDWIIVLPGHEETVAAAAGLDVDTAGITILFLGWGDNRAKVVFGTATGADMDIDAANVTLINFLGESGVDALTGPIDVNTADCTIINGEWRDTAAKAATDCIVADANADRLTIDGWRFIASTTGTQKQSNIQIAGANDVILRNINITGDFGTGCIENGTAWVYALLENVHCQNLSATPTVALVLQSGSSGSVRNSSFRVASGTTYATDASNMQWFNTEGTGTDDARGSPIGHMTGEFLPGLGYRVTKTGDVSATTDALFTVTGKVLVNLVVGEVTSVIATTTSLQLTTSTGTVTLCASTDIITDVVNTLYILTGDPDDTLNGGQTPQADIAMSKTGFHPPFMVNDDGINQTADQAGTGTIQWDVYYYPLEANASITTAA